MTLYENTLENLDELRKEHIEAAYTRFAMAHTTYELGVKLLKRLDARLMPGVPANSYIGAAYLMNMNVPCRCTHIDLGILTDDPFVEMYPINGQDDIGAGPGEKITIKASKL